MSVLAIDPPTRALRAPSAVTEIPIRDETIRLLSFPLEQGGTLETVDVRFRLEGAVNADRSNVVLVVHALTGTIHASAWWRGVIGTGEVLDPAKHAILCANLLGGCDGTTGPSAQDPYALPPFTTRDQAHLLARLLDALGIDAPQLICGGSLGGMVTLEFAASFPERVRRAVVLAAPAVQTAQGIAWNAIMRRALTIGGPRDGLALARMVGMLSYRTPDGLESRFANSVTAEGIPRVASWLDAHGDKLVARFDAASYRTLINVMDTHDVGRGRGGVARALAPVADRLIGVGIPGDLLYPSQSVEEWTTSAQARYVALSSPHGHDAFLLETAQVSAVLTEALRRPATTTATPPSTSPVAPLRVALAGCGHVGGNLLELLCERQANEPLAPPVTVQRVLVRDAARLRPALERAVACGIAPADACITDPSQLLDGDVDVLVEVIGGTATARSLVETALARGIRVVTANKALLGERGELLQARARTQGTSLAFEGAVCGAIPIVRCLQHGAAGVGITRIDGILNGTSNFVLEELAAGHSLEEAITSAQALGYAEADPTRDLNGQDAEDKLRVLAWLAFGVAPSALVVHRRGIDEETAAWARTVATEGDRVKLLASCRHEDDQLVGRIEPVRVAQGTAWGQVTGPFNRIVVESTSAGAIAFQGPGAGGRATAGAVLSDLLR